MVTVTETPGQAPASLPQWLEHQARRQAKGIALRHKDLGVWQTWTWGQVADEVHRLATALDAHGFTVGATLTILSRPRPQALLAALAAQWLGGVASLLDPLEAAAGQVDLLGTLRPDFVLAEGEEEILRLQAAQVQPRVLVYLEERGVADSIPFDRALVYTALVALQPARTLVPQTRAQQTAFVFHRHGAGGVEQQRFSHAELLLEGRRLVEREGLGWSDEALAARAFASGGQARYLLAPWLIAGFRLNFPENLATRDRDRRELGPTLVAGTRETYERLHRQVLERLPQAGSWSRKWVDWALAPHPGLLQRHLGDLLVRRPLRDVLGFSRTRVPLLVGDALGVEARAFFDALAVEVRHWDDSTPWEAPVTSVEDTPVDWLERQSLPA